MERSNGNFLYWQKQSVFPVLCRLYNHCQELQGVMRYD
jgi:hypothetical protein